MRVDSFAHLVGDPLQRRCTLVQQGAIRQNERGHVALGVDGVKVCPAGSLVSTNAHFLGFELPGSNQARLRKPIMK